MSPNRAEMNDDYPVRIWFDAEDDVYVAEFQDLPGCFAPGTSVEEAYRRGQEAKGDWIRIAKEQGLPIPPPSRSDEYSGRFLLRLPTALHGILANRAKDQATSLNQYVVHLLSGAVVGDTLTSQIEQLTMKVASIDTQLGKVSRGVEAVYSEMAKQVAGTFQSSSHVSSMQRTGGAYEAIGNIASESSRIH